MFIYTVYYFLFCIIILECPHEMSQVLDVVGIQLAVDKFQWLDLLNTALHLWVR